MLTDVDPATYGNSFPTNPHPFISEPFIELNRRKAEKVLRLVEEGNKAAIGLVAGVKNGMLHSPFSAPFGGFHFRKEIKIIIGCTSICSQADRHPLLD